MNGLLVRVGIDSTNGCWNAPTRLATGESVYVTITDSKPMRKGLACLHDEVVLGAQRQPGSPNPLDGVYERVAGISIEVYCEAPVPPGGGTVTPSTHGRRANER